MMKVQDVILKAMAKKITWMAAAEIVGVDREQRAMEPNSKQSASQIGPLNRRERLLLGG